MTDDERIKFLEKHLAYALHENNALRENNKALRDIATAMREDVDNCDMYMSYIEELFYKRGVSLHTSERLH